MRNSNLRQTGKKQVTKFEILRSFFSNDQRKELNRRLWVKTILTLTLFLFFNSTNILIGHASQDAKNIKPTKATKPPAYHLNYQYPDKQMVFFSGKVVSNLGKPVAAAEVEINGSTTKTDAKGFFRIAMNKKDAARFVMNIRKDGFGLLSQIYTSGVQNKTWIMTKATTKSFNPRQNTLIRDVRGSSVCLGTLSSRVDWSRYPARRIPRYINSAGEVSEQVSDEVRRAIEDVENSRTCNPGISISVSANTLADSNGNPPQSNVLASLSTVDIYDPDSMPGDYTVRQNNQTGYMVTYGAGTINFTSKGKTYQLKKGAYATVEIPINPAQLKQGRKLEPEIPFLLYDEKEGVWTMAGKASLNEKKNAYIAKVYHFSTMNMDLVKTNQACLRIDSRDIDIDYTLEVTVPGEQPRTFEVDNTPEKLHVIYNLPSNTDISLRAFQAGGMLGPVPITDTIVVNTGDPQNPQTPNCPAYPYNACNSQVRLSPYSLSPVLSLDTPPNSAGTFTLKWEYTWTGLASTSDGYKLEESATSSSSGFTLIYNTAGQSAPDHASPKYYTITRTPGTYYYRVKAQKISVDTPYSNVVQVVVPAVGARQLKITNRIGAGSQRLDSVLQVKVIPPNTQFSYADLLTNDRDTDGTPCFEYPGEEILPGESKTFIITIGNDYWVFIGLGKWELQTGGGDIPGPCSWTKPFGKTRYFVTPEFVQYWPWVSVVVTGHIGDVWEWTITGSYTAGNLYLNPAGGQSLPFNITNSDPIP